MATTAALSSDTPASDSLQKRAREKRQVHHHHHSLPHTRPTQRHVDNRQRKLREKRRPANFISTDGTTSGDDQELVNGDEENSHKLEQMLKKTDQLPSDLDADCEDNNSTDVDTVSVSGSVKSKDTPENRAPRDDIAVLNAKVNALEKQLATVLQVNGKLKEENEQLKRIVKKGP
ncbi:unnamed protein product [Bursaphelenchus xylophilus]|uniref:(pine wood nematode) hypothetical protein n=1 Tax=Bursaphelenchus xylophilus TaxID=6326 RepID=A0A1I7SWL8_BURXY|nr:unnamed protein product [Bursaphelenchus xylophilus]CAG9099641.1 unnamed protein product [Bursaphelenchus xylophilus]